MATHEAELDKEHHSEGGYDMISFVAYFSSAQDEEGYVVLGDEGSAPAEFTDGPAIEGGVYRVEGNGLVRVETVSDSAAPTVEVQ